MSERRETVRAAGIVLHRPGPRGRPLFLLLRNRRHGTWAPPKGHLEPGESELEGALREVAEETGYRLSRVHPSFRRRLRYPVLEKGRRAMKEVTYFLAEAPQGEVVASAEHDDHRWVERSEAASLLPYDDLRDLLAQAEREVLASGPESGG